MESVHRGSLHCDTVIFIPGHTGVKGKERADSLASMATVEDGRVD